MTTGSLSMAVLLPHVGVFGGVRRYLALGNEWMALGHRVTLYTPEGAAPDWYPFRGAVRRFDGLGTEPHDLAFASQPALLPVLRRAPAARRVFYVVLERERGEAEAARAPDLILIANSTSLRERLARRYRRPVLDGAGGVDTELFRPDRGRREPGIHRILAYGRLSRPKKGTALVIRAAERVARRVPGLELALFDHRGVGNVDDPRERLRSRIPVTFHLDLAQEELARLYASATVFVAAERKAGWCNTAIEAMASGTPVVCTPSGTADFARHRETAWVVPIRNPFFLARGLARVLGDGELRARLGVAGHAEAQRHAWPLLARKILDQLGVVASE